MAFSVYEVLLVAAVTRVLWFVLYIPGDGIVFLSILTSEANDFLNAIVKAMQETNLCSLGNIRSNKKNKTKQNKNKKSLR